MPAIKPPATSRHRESYFFFLATLRVFFAVFFTALFAFFAFLAFFAMLHSSLRWLLLAACTRGSNALHYEYTNATKKTASHLKKC